MKGAKSVGQRDGQANGKPITARSDQILGWECWKTVECNALRVWCRCLRLANVQCFDESAFILSESLRDFGVVADAGVLAAPGRLCKKQCNALCRHPDSLTPHPAPGQNACCMRNVLRGGESGVITWRARAVGFVPTLIAVEHPLCFLRGRFHVMRPSHPRKKGRMGWEWDVVLCCECTGELGKKNGGSLKCLTCHSFEKTCFGMSCLFYHTNFSFHYQNIIT